MHNRWYCMRGPKNVTIEDYHNNHERISVFEIIKAAYAGVDFYMEMPNSANDMVKGSGKFEDTRFIPEFGVACRCCSVDGNIIKAITKFSMDDIKGQDLSVCDGYIPWGHTNSLYGDIRIYGDYTRIVKRLIAKEFIWQFNF